MLCVLTVSIYLASDDCCACHINAMCAMSINPSLCVLTGSIHIPLGECHINAMCAMSINPLLCVLTRSIHISSGECCECDINAMCAMYADNVNILVLWADSVNNCYVC